MSQMTKKKKKKKPTNSGAIVPIKGEENKLVISNY